jgi:hypothetical protein
MNSSGRVCKRYLKQCSLKIKVGIAAEVFVTFLNNISNLPSKQRTVLKNYKTSKPPSSTPLESGKTLTNKV